MMTFLHWIFPILLLISLFSANAEITARTAVSSAAASTSSRSASIASTSNSTTITTTTIKCVKSPLLSPVLNIWLPLYAKDNPSISVKCDQQAVVSGNIFSPDQADIMFSDIVLSNADYATANGSDLQMLPVLMSPMVCGYNLPNITTTITLSGAALAAIWAGNITNWSHSTLQNLNPGISLPNQPITLVAYMGSHEYTTILTTMLSSLSSGWKSAFGTFSSASGFSKVSSNTATYVFIPNGGSTTLPFKVQSTPYSLSFITLYESISQGLSFALMLNKNGISTFPFPQPAKTDMETATFTSRLTTSAVALPGLSTYPLVNVIYAVVHINTSMNCEVTSAIVDFLTWILQSPVAASTAQTNGYFALPSTISSIDMNKLVTSLKCNSKLYLRDFAVVLGGGSKQSGSLFDLLVFKFSSEFSNTQMSYLRASSATGLLMLEQTPPTLDFLVYELNVQPTDFAKVDMVVIPAFIAGLAIVCNIPGIATGVTAVFSREVVVGVFNGTISYWNHPLITQSNPFIVFPASPITLVTISGAYSMVLTFKQALNAFDSNWGKYYDISTNSTWPSTLGSRMVQSSSFDGVAATVQITPYSLGFIPQTTLITAGSNVKPVSIPNVKGNIVTASVETLTSVASSTTFDSTFQGNVIDATGDLAYPIVSFTRFVLRKSLTGANCAAVKAALDFVLWVSENETVVAVAQSMGYIPVFRGTSSRVHSALGEITCNGDYIYPQTVPSSTVTEAPSSVNIIPIIIPVVVVVVVVSAIIAFFVRRLMRRLSKVTDELSDAKLAVELADAIAVFALERMEFLKDVTSPTPTQRCFLKILKVLTYVKKYVPQGVLFQLQHEDDGGSETDGEGDREGVSMLQASADNLGVPKIKSTSTISASVKADGGVDGGGESGGEGHDKIRRFSSSTTKSVKSRASAATSGMPRGSSSLNLSRIKGGDRRGTTMSRQISHESGGQKAVRRMITALFLKFVNFGELLKADFSTALRQHATFTSNIYPAIGQQSGTIGLFDGDKLVIHWNGARRSRMACLQACELAAKLSAAATNAGFKVQIGLASEDAWYTSIGCDSMSNLSVLGNLMTRAEMLQQLNSYYGTTVIADHEVKKGGCEEGLFLLDYIMSNISSPARIYELMPEKIISRTDFQDEWMYSFDNKETENNDAGKDSPQKLWERCVDTFYKGGYEQAAKELRVYLAQQTAGSSKLALASPAFIEYTKELLNAAQAQKKVLEIAQRLNPQD